MDNRIVAAIITAAAAVVLFVGKEIWVILQERARHRLAQRQFASGLLAEVSYNIKDLEAFIRDSVDQDAIRRFIHEKNAPPHVTDAKHTRLYASSIERLFEFDSETIAKLVEFYSHLDKLENQIAGLQLESFKEISEEGKIATVDYIFKVARAAIDLGRHAEKSLNREVLRLSRR